MSSVRKRFQLELIKRFETNERIGHIEDLMVSTLLDPRYVDLNPNIAMFLD